VYLNINQDQDRALPGGEQRFPLCCSVQGQVALQPWRRHLGGSSVSFQSPHLSAYATPPIYTVSSWRARGRRLQGALCKGHDPTSRSSDGSPLSRVAGWPDHTASPPHPTPFVSRVCARICQRVAHVHLTQIPLGARQARLAPSCIQARAWLPSTGDRSSRIASTLSPRRVDQLG